MHATDPRLARLVESGSHPELRLLVLFGSRARGDAQEGADWDFGFLGDPAFDADALLGELMAALQADRVDLVDLGRAGGQVRFRVARDGRLVYERSPGEFQRFWFEAVSFWCDVAPVLEPAYEAVLSRLG